MELEAHLQCLLLMLAALTLTATTSKEGGAPDAEVLILGAGIAGIAAAKTLSEHKVTNFLILEAENRIERSCEEHSVEIRCESGVRCQLDTRNRPQST